MHYVFMRTWTMVGVVLTLTGCVGLPEDVYVGSYEGTLVCRSTLGQEEPARVTLELVQDARAVEGRLELLGWSSPYYTGCTPSVGVVQVPDVSLSWECEPAEGGRVSGAGRGTLVDGQLAFHITESISTRGQWLERFCDFTP